MDAGRVHSRGDCTTLSARARSRTECRAGSQRDAAPARRTAREAGPPVSAARPTRRIVMFDPGSFIPYYVDALCRGLGALGARARVVASPPLFEAVDAEDRYDVDWHFFPFLRGTMREL